MQDGTAIRALSLTGTTTLIRALSLISHKSSIPYRYLPTALPLVRQSSQPLLYPWLLLIARFMLRLDDGSRVWIQCRYERLHKLSNRCGLIGHTRRQCTRCMDNIMMMLFRQRQESMIFIRFNTNLMLYSHNLQMNFVHFTIVDDVSPLKCSLVIHRTSG